MQVKVKAAGKKSRLIRESVYFFAARMMTYEEQKDLDITVLLTNKFPRCQSADMEYDDGEVIIRLRPYSNFWLMFRSIEHEMVDVKQFHLGELDDLDEDVTLFNGKKYIEEDINYYERPWEIEAMGRERGLTINFLESKGMYTWELMSKKERVHLLL